MLGLTVSGLKDQLDLKYNVNIIRQAGLANNYAFCSCQVMESKNLDDSELI